MAGARRGKSRKLRKAAPVSDPAKAKEDADIDEASNDRPVELNQASKGDEKVVTPKRGKQKTIKSKNGKKTLVNVDVEKSYNEGEEVPNASKRKPSNSKSGKKQQVKMESLDSGMEEKPKASKWEASKSKSGMKEQMIVDSSDTEDDESMMAGNYYGSPNIHDDRDEEKLLESSGSSNEDERKNNMISFDTNKTEKDDEKVESLVSSDSSDDSGGDEHYHKELNRTPVKVQEPTGNRPKEKVKQCETQHEKHDDDSELRLGTMRRLLTFLPQKKLIEIVSLAATQYDQLYNHLKVAVGSSVVHRKVFVRELAWDTKSEKLKEAFACFGEIQDASIINNTTEGTSSVYGVVIFNDMEAAQRAVQKKCLVIDDHAVWCRFGDEDKGPQPPKHGRPAPPGPPEMVLPAPGHGFPSHPMPFPAPGLEFPPGPPEMVLPAPGHGFPTHPMPFPAPGLEFPVHMMMPMHPMQMHPMPMHPMPTHSLPMYPMQHEAQKVDRRQLFVRGLSENTTVDSIRHTFREYGELENVYVPRDKGSGKCKGYAFLIFRHLEAAQRALDVPSKIIDGAVTICNVNYQVRKQPTRNDPSMGRLPVNGKAPNHLLPKNSEKRPPSFDAESSKLSKKRKKNKQAQTS